MATGKTYNEVRLVVMMFCGTTKAMAMTMLTASNMTMRQS
jgi:hypothetical protein